MRALFTTMQRDVALGTGALEVGTRRYGSCAVVTSRRRNALDHAWQTRTSNIYWWARALRAGSVCAAVTIGLAASSIHITALFVFAIVVH